MVAQPVRPVRGLQCRHFAGAGDRAPGPGLAVAGGGRRGAAHGRARGARRTGCWSRGSKSTPSSPRSEPGPILYGLNAWYTGGQQVLATLPPEFLAISGSVWIFPRRRSMLSSSASTLWIVFEYLPLGRYLYVLGASPRARSSTAFRRGATSRLASSPPERSRPSPASCCSRSLQVGQSSVGQEYLLPAFTAALLGATSVRPGRVNVWGTVLAVAVLAVTVAGLNQLGAPFFVEPLFNGSMLILAVGLAVQAAQRRQRRGTRGRQGRAVATTPRRSSQLLSGVAHGRRDPDAGEPKPSSDDRTGSTRAGDAKTSGAIGNLMTPPEVARGDRPHQDRRDRQSRHALRFAHAARAGARLCVAHAGRPHRGPLWTQEQDDLERRIHRHRNRTDRHPDGRARPSRLHVRRTRRQDQHALLQRQQTLRHVVAVWAHETRNRKCPAFFHPRRPVRCAGPERTRARCRRGDQTRRSHGLSRAAGRR